MSCWPWCQCNHPQSTTGDMYGCSWVYLAWIYLLLIWIKYHKWKATTVTPALETLVSRWSKWSWKPLAKMCDSEDSCLKLLVDSIYSTAQKKSKCKSSGYDYYSTKTLECLNKKHHLSSKDSSKKKSLLCSKNLLQDLENIACKQIDAQCHCYSDTYCPSGTNTKPCDQHDGVLYCSACHCWIHAVYAGLQIEKAVDGSSFLFN